MNPSNADYYAILCTESKSSELNINRTSGSASKMSGFFEVKSNNNGTFYILSSGGKSELYLSHTGEPSEKVLMNLQYSCIVSIKSQGKIPLPFLVSFMVSSLLKYEKGFHRETSYKRSTFVEYD